MKGGELRAQLGVELAPGAPDYLPPECGEAMHRLWAIIGPRGTHTIPRDQAP